MSGYTGSDKAIRFLYNQIMQYNVIPEASVEMEGKIIQYTGVSDNEFINGYFYRCIKNIINGTANYNWIRIDTQNSQEAYLLPIATSDTLGGVKIGNNISIDEEGFISTIPYLLPIATNNSLGGVKVGNNINIDNQGHISVDAPVRYKAICESNFGDITTETEVASFPFYPNGDTTFILNGSISGEVTVDDTTEEEVNCDVVIKVKLDGSDYLTFKQTCTSGNVVIPVNCAINVRTIANHIIQVTVSVTNGSITL